MSIEISGVSLPLRTTSPQTAQATGGAGFSDVLKSARDGQAVDLDAIFQAASEKYGVSVSLLKAVAKAESNFNPNAVSRCGAMGIMQLMPGTAASLGVTEPFDPEQNIMGGAKYLSGLLDQFGGDVRLAVAAYNAGPGNVKKYGGVPPFDETQNYVVKVLGYLGTDISAGKALYTGAAGGSGKALYTGAADGGSALGELLKYSLLSGMFDSGELDSLPGLFSALGTELGDTAQSGLSDTAMLAAYQLQMRMLQGDDGGSGVIV